MRDGERLTIPVAPAGTSLAARLLTVGLPVLVLVGALSPGLDGSAVTSPLPIILSGVALLAAVPYRLAPRRLGYILTPGELVMQRLTGQLRLSVATLEARPSSGRLDTEARIVGSRSKMPGYFVGDFVFGPDAHRSVIAAASRPDNGVIVEQAGQAYFLTPADPDAFLAELQRRGATVTR